MSRPSNEQTSFDRQRKKINTLLAKELKGKFIKFIDIHYPGDYLNDFVHMQDNDPTSVNRGIPVSPTPVSPTPISPTPISPTPVSPTRKCLVCPVSPTLKIFVHWVHD